MEPFPSAGNSTPDLSIGVQDVQDHNSPSVTRIQLTNSASAARSKTKKLGFVEQGEPETKSQTQSMNRSRRASTVSFDKQPIVVGYDNAKLGAAPSALTVDAQDIEKKKTVFIHVHDENDDDEEGDDLEANDHFQKPLQDKSSRLDKLAASGHSLATSNRSGASGMSTTSNAVSYLWNRFMIPLLRKYDSSANAKKVTRHYLLFWPVFAVVAVCSLNIVLVHVAASVTLPQLIFFNLFHILLYLMNEIVVSVVNWASHQMTRYETSWRLAHSTLFAGDVARAADGSLGQMGRVINFLLVCFRLSVLAVTFFAEWEASPSALGSNACLFPTYDVHSLESYKVNPDFVSGDVDFAEAYMYGFPLADGILAGFGPWPSWAPLRVFSLSGPGPLVVIRVDCDEELVEWYGQNKSMEGSGSLIKSLNLGQRSFNANVEILLPVAGFNKLSANSTWFSQQCRFDGYLGKAKWEFEYKVDEWNMVSAGQATSMTFRDIAAFRYETIDLNSDYFLEALRKASKDADQYDFSTPTSEGRLLISAIGRALETTMNDIWYEPNQGGTFSNFMSWATEPDGFYYPEFTARGLSAAIGADLHQVFLQYSTADEESCVYSGNSGAGKMTLVIYLVDLTTVLLGLIAALFLSQGVFIWLMFPIRNALAFTYSAKIVLFEQIRMLYMHQMMRDIQERRNNINEYGIIETFNETKVKFGEKRETMSEKIGSLWVGPSSDTVKLRANRAFRHGTPANE